MGWGPDMAQAQTYYDYEFSKGLNWWFIREEIGQGLRELYEVPTELPSKLLELVRKLDASSPHSRTLLSKLDAIEGKCLCRYAPPAEPRTVGPDDDWSLCT